MAIFNVKKCKHNMKMKCENEVLLQIFFIDHYFNCIVIIQNQKIKWTLLKSLFELLEQKKSSNNSCFHYIKNKHNIMHYINMNHLDKLKLDIDLL